jgi:hypothetical protein
MRILAMFNKILAKIDGVPRDAHWEIVKWIGRIGGLFFLIFVVSFLFFLINEEAKAFFRGHLLTGILILLIPFLITTVLCRTLPGMLLRRWNPEKYPKP